VRTDTADTIAAVGMVIYSLRNTLSYSSEPKIHTLEVNM